MKTSFLLICIAVIPLIHAWPYKKCPEIPKDTLVDLDFKAINGNWIVAGTKPKFSEKCINITISTNDKSEITLHEDYISKVLYFWHKTSSRDYTVEKDIKTPVLKLKNKAWYSLEKEELNLIGADYGKYLLFYSCSRGLFNYSETFELWTHDTVDMTADVTTAIEAILIKFNAKPEDLAFRTVKDCKK